MAWLPIAVLFCALGAPAHADPLSTIVAVSAWAANLSGVGLAIAQAVVGLGLSYASSLLTRQTISQRTARARASEVSSIIAKRFVYGHCVGPAAPLAYEVKGRAAVVCVLLNSRPSHGGFTLRLDKRPVVFDAGDPYDFDGPGMASTDEPFPEGSVRMWVGRGAQMGPPDDLLDEFDDYLLSTDAFRGLTVAWFRFQAYNPAVRAERFARWLPEIEVEGDWSLIWDPRDEAQVGTDPSTWAFSRNRSLITLDFLRQNPVAQYRGRNLDIESFRVAADCDDEPVSLKAGGTEPRWQADGLVLLDGAEIQEVAEALYASGAGRLIRSGGRLAVSPGKWVPPVATISAMLADGDVEFSNLQTDTAPEVEARYIRPDMDWQPDSAGIWTVVNGNPNESPMVLQLDFVTAATQAQRLAQITARRLAAQKRLGATFAPEAFKVIAGDNANVSTPYAVMDGAYEAYETAPVVFSAPGEGVAMRSSLRMAETAEAHFAWNPVTDERDVAEPPEQNPIIAKLAPPGDVTAVSGAAAGGSSPRIRFSFDPSPSGRVQEYEWQWRPDGGSWQSGGMIDADVRDGSNNVFGTLREIDAGDTFDIRVRSVDADSSVSLWVVEAGIVVLPPDLTISPPTNMTATGGVGLITISARLPNQSGVQAIEFWVATVNDSASASFLVRLYAGSNATVEHDHAVTGTRHYWAKTVGPYGAVSGFSGHDSATAS